ncbi:MAG: hypothetical protein CSA72_01185 [Rhodobacterales bacterium]|nr:MAG: hypothetical protein CSA72_01185 [Rhodobacterales bacterium]
MIWLWRTPRGLERMSWRRAGLLCLAAFITVPAIGFALSGFSEPLLALDTRFTWLTFMLLALAYSPLLSWSGFLLSVAPARAMMRRGWGGAGPISGLGAVMGLLTGLIRSWEWEPFFLSLCAAAGAVCMAVWWGWAILTAPREAL